MRASAILWFPELLVRTSPPQPAYVPLQHQGAYAAKVERAAIIPRSLERRKRTTNGVERFCVHEQIEQGFPPLCAMPALPSTVLMHLGWLSTEDKVHAGSLHPYLSAINQCHIDFGFAAPTLGHDVCLSRKAFGYVEGQHTLKTSQ